MPNSMFHVLIIKGGCLSGRFVAEIRQYSFFMLHKVVIVCYCIAVNIV